jgi:transcriptional regulator with XRE-family HTH domain
MSRVKGKQEDERVDQHVGAQIKSRRQELGLTQVEIAEALGVTFQQVQKYERGSNRIAASKLWLVAKCLDVSPAYFFEGLEQ